MSTYYTCELCKEVVRGNHFTIHLRDRHGGLLAEDYYHRHVLKSDEVPKCRTCGKVMEFIRLSLPYQEFCSKDCSSDYVSLNLTGVYQRVKSGGQATTEHSGKKNYTICQLCDKEIYDKFFPSHLEGCHGVSARDYYHKYILKSEDVPNCKYCGSKLEFIRLSLPYPEFCSSSCKMKNQWENKGLYERVKKGAQTRWNDPAYHEKMSKVGGKILTEMNKRNHADPEWRATKHKSWGVQGWHDSPKAGKVYYRSSWELEACIALDDLGLVKTYKLEPFGIPYGDGTDKSYYPDILITYYDDYQEIIEIKPSFRLFEEETMFKIKLGLDYAFRNNLGFQVWTKNNWPLPVIENNGD